MSASVSRIIIWLIVAAAIVALGWTKPLRYRFMSAEQIAELEHVNDPTPVPVRVVAAPTPFIPRSTMLDVTPPKRH